MRGEIEKEMTYHWPARTITEMMSKGVTEKLPKTLAFPDALTAIDTVIYDKFKAYDIHNSEIKTWVNKANSKMTEISQDYNKFRSSIDTRLIDQSQHFDKAIKQAMNEMTHLCKSMVNQRTADL